MVRAVWDDEGTMVGQFGMMKRLGETAIDDDVTMKRQFGMMKGLGETV